MTPAQTAPTHLSRSSPLRGLDPEVLVRGLEDLSRGPDVQLLLISMGEPAVPALTRFLLGPPGLHPQPRVLAAEALGAIAGAGAIRALIAAMCRGPIPGLAAVLTISEEAVRNAAARELGRIGDRSAAGPLLYVLRRSHLIDAGRALLRFHDGRAIPALVKCLEDSFVRERAAGLLLGFGAEATEALVNGLVHREERDGIETPRSNDRRTACARILGTLRAERGQAILRQSLGDPAREVRTAAAVALARVAPDAGLADRIPVLIEGLGDPLMADDCGDALMIRPGLALPRLLDAIYSEAAAIGSGGARTPSRRLRAMVRALAGTDARGERALWRLASDPDPILRGLTLGQLAKRDPALAAPLVEACLRDPDARVRRTAAACARQLGLTSSHRPVGSRLMEMLREGLITRLVHLVHRCGHA